jgi:hypothetical protein
MIPKVGVSMSEVNAARAIRKACVEGNNDDNLGIFCLNLYIIHLRL